MKRWLLLLLLLGARVEAQVVSEQLRTRTAAQLTALDAILTAFPPDDRRYLYICSDCASTSDCTTGGGTTENVCRWSNDTDNWEVIGGGGSGDIESVWTDTTGDVSALTAAAGDSLDAGSADASSPATRSTSLPGTCTEGQFHQDTDLACAEVHYCKAANTWEQLLSPCADDDDPESINLETLNMVTGIADDEVPVGTGTDDVTFKAVPDCDDGKLLYDTSTNAFSCGVDALGTGGGGVGEYSPDNFPPADDCYGCDEFSDGVSSLSWSWGNQGSCSVTLDSRLDAVRLEAPDIAGTNELCGRWTSSPGDGVGDWQMVAKVREYPTASRECGVWVLTGGSTGTPTEIYSIGLSYASYTSGMTIAVRRYTSYAVLASTPASASPPSDATRDVYLIIRYIDSSNSVYFYWSTDGRFFADITNVTETPAEIGYFCDKANGSNSKILGVDFVRIFDQNMNDGAAFFYVGN